MDLTDEDKKILEPSFDKWFKEGPKCPICQNDGWAVNNKIFEIPEFLENPRKQMQKAVYPVIILNCSICGYCIILSAMQLGLISQNSSEDKAKGGSAE
jgi:hypothetical protein